MRFAAALITFIAAASMAGGVTLTGQAPPAAVAPTDVCAVDDPRATELSGLVANGPGYVAVNDGQDDPNDIRVIYLDGKCKVTSTLRYPTAARDPEDVAIAPDGTIWVGDIGDNLTSQTRRQSVALWRVPAGGGAPVIHRLTYSDGPHDAEALLFTGDGTPLIVTKETTGTAFLYAPTGPLQPQSAAGVAMKRVGQFAPRSSGENNLLGAVGETMVTGAATSPDRRRVVLRTYTAAYEWDVPDGDVVKAITTTTPRLTALPDEPQGEAISYSPDGKSFLTLSDEPDQTTLRSHVPSTLLLAPPPPSLTPTPAVEEKTGLAAVPIWYSVAAGVGGLALLSFGLLGVRRARRDPSDVGGAGTVR